VPAAAASNAAVMMPGSSHPPARTAAHTCAQTCGGGSLRTAARDSGSDSESGCFRGSTVATSTAPRIRNSRKRQNSAGIFSGFASVQLEKFRSSSAPLQPARDHQVLTSRLGDRVRPHSNTFQELQEFSLLL
jgi:hypothetical protein